MEQVEGALDAVRAELERLNRRVADLELGSRATVAETTPTSPTLSTLSRSQQNTVSTNHEGLEIGVDSTDVDADSNSSDAHPHVDGLGTNVATDAAAATGDADSELDSSEVWVTPAAMSDDSGNSVNMPRRFGDAEPRPLGDFGTTDSDPEHECANIWAPCAGIAGLSLFLSC